MTTADLKKRFLALRLAMRDLSDISTRTSAAKPSLRSPETWMVSKKNTVPLVSVIETLPVAVATSVPRS